MAAGVQFKVCGLTSAVDAAAADQAGAAFLGFNLYPQSPRHIPLHRYRELEPELPKTKRVAVMVEPDEAGLAEAAAAGFDFFQIHFRPEAALSRIAGWSRAVGPARLWLAPKLPPALDVAPAWLPLAQTFMLDAFAEDRFGGTGRTGDWEKFARHRSAHPGRRWLLAGGLGPANVADALRRSGADFVDANSGVESSPGVKDHAKLKAFADAIRARARAGGA